MFVIASTWGTALPATRRFFTVCVTTSQAYQYPRQLTCHRRLA
jgi:hypothetical protein